MVGNKFIFLRCAPMRDATIKLEIMEESFALDMEQRSILVRLKGARMMPRVMDESVEGMGLRKFTRRNALQRDALVMHKEEGYVISTQEILVRYVPTRIARILPSREEFVEGTERYVKDVCMMVVRLRQDPIDFVLNTESK